MCGPALIAALPALQGIGTAMAIGGTLVQGISGYQAGQAQARAYGKQIKTEQQLTATQDQRERDQFQSAMAQQRAELAARGIQLDSVTAVMLGRKAAQEMSFQSQSTRSQGQAKVAQLSNSQALAKADAINSILMGTTSAASKFLTAAPDIWPGLLSGGAGHGRP